MKKPSKPKKPGKVELTMRIGGAKLPTMMAILDAVTPVVRITNRRPDKETLGKKQSDVVYFDAEYGDPIRGTKGSWAKDILNALWAAAVKLNTTITIQIIPGSVKHTIIEEVEPTSEVKLLKKSKFFA